MDITVSIGRNVGDQPMSPERWLRYRAELQGIVEQAGYTITNRESGVSQYKYDEQWHVEQFDRIWATNPLPGASGIRDELHNLAVSYEQWGIAYTVVKFTEVVEGVAS